MEKDYLGRVDAPVSAETWKLLDTAMIEAAKSQLSGRRLISIEGPFGFGLKVIPLSDSEIAEGITASPVIPVNLLTSTFFLNKRDLAASEKNGLLLDMDPVACAAMACAAKEDSIIFHGIQDVPGLLGAEGSGSLALAKWDKVGTAADQVINAVTLLDDAGLHGPYCMGLAPAQYNLLLRRYPQGDGTELDHIRTIIGGDVIKAPVLKKGGVLLASGRQFCSLVIGQDMSIGYNGPAGDALEFSISESLALLIRVPEAICVLT
ncbi:MAG: family 1 encapsulin nanocompartment shell protein [Methanoregula sp.]|uniref:family 1 encapsulin nanocompartment shell protein n=1 Tax=Methanoregula sp. TaxID=2052170 RepID=UPI003C1A7D53